MSPTDRRDEIAASLRSLVQAYCKALSHLEETLAVICRELDLGEIEMFYEPLASRQDPVEESARADRPLIDRTLLSVEWRGKTCFLGNTLPFRLLERLARRPNQYFSYEQLLDDVWEGPRSFSAVRSVVKVLRKKLTAAGMNDLANAIDGTVCHHYGLMLARSK
jgi:DNA-binding response OmpR family regulator